MSTIEKINFEPLSDILHTQRRDYSLADPNLADPVNADALVDGEWMFINDAFKLVRATDVSAAVGSVPAVKRTSYPLFAERGRYDVRALSGVKTDIIQFGDWAADTRIFDATQLAASNGAQITYVGQPLQVATIQIGSKKVSGLVGHDGEPYGSGAAANAIVARVLRLPNTNGGKLMIEKASTI